MRVLFFLLLSVAFDAYAQSNGKAEGKQPATAAPAPTAKEVPPADGDELSPTPEDMDDFDIDDKIQEPDTGNQIDPYQQAEQNSNRDAIFPDGRAGKIFGLALRYGLAVGFVPASGVEAYYHINRDLQVGVGVFQGKGDLRSRLTPVTGASSDKLDIETGLQIAFARYFISNNVFVGGAFGRRTVKSDFELRSTSSNARYSGRFDAKSTVAGVILGNIWTWTSGFFVGIDWIGYMVPLASKVNPSDPIPTESSQPTDKLEDLKSDADKITKDIGKRPTPYLLAFNIGYAF